MLSPIAYAVTCAHPPYAVLPVIFVFTGFGNGLEVRAIEKACDIPKLFHFEAYSLSQTV